MPKTRATQTDIARRAGVSQAMVSYVVNGNTRVSIPDETRRRIEAVMEELGYVPNALARGLRSGQTRTIGLVVPDNTNPFFAEIARRIENLGYEKGFSVILCNSDYDLAKENAHVDVLLAKQVDGVIFCASGGSGGAQQRLLASKTPVVTIDHDISNQRDETVLIDYRLGGYLATRHLLEQGHRQIGCITGPRALSSSAGRLTGYRDALKESGLRADTALTVPGDFRIQGGEAAALKLLRGRRRPSAIFAFNDLMAIGAMQAARILGLSVPADVSIVGFDDIPLAQAIYPALTTIAQPISEIARLAMEVFFKQIRGGVSATATPAGPSVVLKPALITRSSTAPFAR